MRQNTDKFRKSEALAVLCPRLSWVLLPPPLGVLLVAWLFGVSLHASTERIGNAIEMADSTLHQPDICYNPTAAKLLVVWQQWLTESDYDIYGCILNTDGSNATSSFRISRSSEGEAEFSPRVACANGSEWIVTYTSKTTDARWWVLATTVKLNSTSDGAVVGSEIVVASSLVLSTQRSSVSVGGCTDKNEALIVWQEGGDDVRGRRYDLANNVTISTEFKFGGWTTDTRRRPSISRRGKNYYVAWERVKSDTEVQIEGAYVSNTNDADVSTTKEISSGNLDSRPAVAARTDADEFMVVFERLAAGTTNDYDIRYWFRQSGSSSLGGTLASSSGIESRPFVVKGGNGSDEYIVGYDFASSSTGTRSTRCKRLISNGTIKREETVFKEITNGLTGARGSADGTGTVYTVCEFSENESRIAIPLGKWFWNGGSIQFAETDYSVPEGGEVSLKLTRTGGDDGQASVSIKTANGTAGALDFTGRDDGSQVWNEGESDERSFPVSTTADTISEVDENFTVSLSGPAGCSLGTPSSATVTITDGMDLPAVTTVSSSSVTNNSASVSGNVTARGGATVTQRGVVYAMTPNPTTSNWKSISGSGTGTFTATLSGLSAGTTYYARAYAINSAGTAYGSQINFTTTTPPASLPTVFTLGYYQVTHYSAWVGGYVYLDGDMPVTERGVAYATTQNPTIFGGRWVSGDRTEEFHANLSFLNAETTYYARAYAINSAGIAYGSQIEFTTTAAATPSPPTVTTVEVSSVTRNSALVHGYVNSDGGAKVTQRGVVYATTQNPTTSDSKSISDSGTGAFTATLSGLSAGTTYYARAYAINSAGTGYATNQAQITTQAGNDDFADAIELSGVSGQATGTNNDATKETAEPVHAGISGGRSVWWHWTAPSSGDATIDTDGSNFDTLLAVYTGSSLGGMTAVKSNDDRDGSVQQSQVQFSAVSGTIYRIAVDGFHGDSGAITLNWKLLPTVTTAPANAVTHNSATVSGNVTSDGGATVTERGVVYATTQNPTTSDGKSISGDGTGTFTATLSGLSASTNYYARAYATNNTGTSYGTEINFTTTTPPASPVINSFATASGQVGVAFNYQITASNNPTSFGATGLPPGLSVNTPTGLISGTPTTAGTSTATVTAANGGGYGSQDILITINPPTPVISSLATASGQVGVAFNYQITASNSPTGFNAIGLPPGLSVNPSTGQISGTPTTAGTSTATVTATNGGGNGNQTVTITISPRGAPVISSSATASGQVGVAFSYQISASNNPTSYNASGLPPGLSVNTATGRISGTPTTAGTSTAIVKATNASGDGNQEVTITISPLAAPVITSFAAVSGQVGVAFSYQITASNNPTTFGATGLPPGLSVNTATGRISGTPTTAGTSTAIVTAKNAGGEGSQAVAITINPPTPVISSFATASGQVGVAFNYQITASNSPTSFGATGLPPGLSVNTLTGLISGTPTTAGTSTATVTATNSGGNGNRVVTITIHPSAPVINSSATASGQVGVAFSYQISASNSPTSFGATGLPPGLSVNTSTGLISGTPTTAGTSAATVTATNSGGNGNRVVTITISPPAAPVISSSAAVGGQVGLSFIYQITASNSPTGFNASGLPPGLSVNTLTGLISGTPTTAGTSTATVTATNAGGNGSQAVTITISPHGAPVISGSATASGQVGVAFSYQISASNSPTSFGATGLPPGLSVNTSTGQISGTPTTAGTSAATVTATNTAGNGVTGVTITISPPAAPVINSSATASGKVGEAFSYQITASNNPTSYGASGLPTGLSINTATGLISGTPTTAGNRTATVTATNSGGDGNQALAITINPPKPVISSSAKAYGNVGVQFSYQITASNIPTSYDAGWFPNFFPPPGLSVNTMTGLISGTPTTSAAGSWTATVGATNAGGTGTKSVVITISPPGAPAISNSTVVGMERGAAFNYQITASNNPTSFNASGLPQGLSINTLTGRIFGTPTTIGSWTVTVSATNPIGTGSKEVKFDVHGGGGWEFLDITGQGTASGQVGVPFNYQITASNNPTSFGATGLPPGLSVNTSTGWVSGTPTTWGSWAATVTASNAGGSGEKAITITINPATPVISGSATAAGQVGVAFNYQITASNSPTSYGASELPTGLSVNTSTGLISGTPTSAGTSTATVTATNAGGEGSQDVTITVNPANPVIDSSATASGQIGAAFGYQITASNSPTGYDASGLPQGLSVDTSTGRISGTPTTAGTSTATITATNAGGSGSQAVIITISPPAAPEISSSATVSGQVGVAFSYQISGSNNPTSYNASGLPQGLSVNTSTGRISGTPTTAGTSTANVTATNAGGSGSQIVVIAIHPATPVISSSDTSNGQVGVVFSYQISASNNPTSYGASGLPPGLSVNASTGLISGTPTTAGTATATVTASHVGGTGGKSVTITIGPPAAPVINSSSTVSGQVGVAFSYQISGSNNPTSYNASGLPQGLSVNTLTGLISGTPTTAGTSTANVTATNDGATGSKSVTITISPPVAPVIVSSGTASGQVGVEFSYQINASSSPASFGASGLPTGLSVDASTGLISGTPTTAGTLMANVTATNAGGSGNRDLTITIHPATPVISGSGTASGQGGVAFSYQISASNSPTSFGATGLPPGLSIDTSTGLISGTPTTVGTSTVTVTATNVGGSGNRDLTITIHPATPAINSSATASGQVGVAFSYQIAASDGPTTFGASELPAGLSVDTSSGLISGTPTSAGSTPVTVTASNAGGTGSKSISITISPLAAPVISSSATSSGQVGVAFIYQIIASNNPTSYGASGLPAGLSANPSTGLISGTPTTASTSTATVTATNAGGEGNQVMAITIHPPAPVISSFATASGQVGVAFSYQITASNSPTSYNASGLPPGLSVNSSSGLISGKPTSAVTSTATVTATNAGGEGNQTVTITINPATPVISSSGTASGQVEVAFSYQITASNSPTSFGATGLPAGLSVDTSTGLISGTPTAAGTSTASVTATNSGGEGTQVLTIGISLPPAPVINSSVTANGQVGVAFSYQITASNNPTSYDASTLPEGLSVDTSTGLISGTPTTAGTSMAAVTATNVGGEGSQTVTITISPPAAPVINSLAIVSGQVGVVFNYQIAASNSPTSYGASGLPPGLSVDTSTGLISGTPTTAGTSMAALTATNVGGEGSQDVTITVNPANPVISGSGTASGQVGVPFSYQISASNGPTRFGATGLPWGLSVNSSTGLISGTPTIEGSSTATVTATNDGGGGSRAVTISIGPPAAPMVSSFAMASGQVGVPFSYQIIASNSPTSFGATGLPLGLAVNASTGLISGTPTTEGTSTTTVTATNSGGDGNQDVTITITPSAPELVVEYPQGTALADGAATLAFGSVEIGGSPATLTVTVRNTGSADLTGLAITKDGANTGDFMVGGFGVTSLAPAASTTFSVTFAPGGAGSRTATIRIASDDADENPFEVDLAGTGATPLFSYTAANGKVTITRYNGSDGVVTVPATINGLPVAIIGKQAFEGLGFMTDVTISTGIAIIEYAAFRNCSQLRSVAIPQTVTSLTGSVFQGCRELTEITIPNSVIGIGASTFTNCSKLIAVRIPASVKIIAGPLFNGCNSLISIDVDPANPNFSSMDGVCFNKTRTTLLEFPAAKSGAYAVPAGVTTIGTQAFYWCGGLTSVTFPAGIQTIADYAFLGCSSLADLCFVGAPPTVGGNVFQSCPASVYYLEGSAAWGSALGGLPTVMANLPSVTTNTIDVSTPTSATLRGSVNPNGPTTTAWFEWGLTAAYGNTSSVVPSPTSGSSEQVASTDVSGLQPLTAYHYRLVASNGFGRSAGADMTFVTPDALPEIVVEQSTGADLTDGDGVIAFGSVNLGSDFGARTCTIKNTGSADLTGLLITKDGANAADFTVGSLGATTLAPNESMTFTVCFAPGGTGQRSAAIHIASNDADENPFDIALAGTGLAPEIVVEHPAGESLVDGTASINFGDGNVGGAAVVKTFTVRNTGSADLTGLAVTKDGANSADFTVGSLGTTTLAPAASTTFTVSFAPGAVGSRAAAIHIAGNDGDESQFDIAVTGVGVADADDGDLDGMTVAFKLRIVNASPVDPIRVVGDVRPTEDFDNDGLPNLIEFAVGGDPTMPDAGRQPKTGIATVGGKKYLTLTFHRLKSAPTLFYQVQESANLQTWFPVGIAANLIGTPVDKDDGTEVITVHASVPISTGVRFLRLAVRRETDSDKDGMDDAFEQRIADAKATDAITGPAQVTGSGDFDGDGVEDLAEFIFGMDPTTGGQRERMPCGAIVQVGGQRCLTITYRRLKGAQPARVVVQESTNLTSWTSVDQAVRLVGGAVDMGDGTERITVRTSDPVSVGAPRFLRVVVESD